MLLSETLSLHCEQSLRITLSHSFTTLPEKKTALNFYLDLFGVDWELTYCRSQKRWLSPIGDSCSMTKNWSENDRYKPGERITFLPINLIHNFALANQFARLPPSCWESFVFTYIYLLHFSLFYHSSTLASVYFLASIATKLTDVYTDTPHNIETPVPLVFLSRFYPRFYQFLHCFIIFFSII